MLRLCLLPCQVPSAAESRLTCPCQGALAQLHCPVSTSTAIHKRHRVQQYFPHTEMLLLQILGGIWISVMLRSQTLIELYPVLFDKTFDPNIQISWFGCFPAPAVIPCWWSLLSLGNSCFPTSELHI